MINGKGVRLRGSTEESRLLFKSTAQNADYVAFIEQSAREVGMAIEIEHCEDLAECIALVGGARQRGCSSIVLNPGGFTLDESLGAAVAQVVDAGTPVWEVHYSNFNQKGVSAVGRAATGVFYGAKLHSYRFALAAAATATSPEWTAFDHPPPSSV